jgi:hypothetical protein
MELPIKWTCVQTHAMCSCALDLRLIFNLICGSRKILILKNGHGSVLTIQVLDTGLAVSQGRCTAYVMAGSDTLHGAWMQHWPTPWA